MEFGKPIHDDGDDGLDLERMLYSHPTSEGYEKWLDAMYENLKQIHEALQALVPIHLPMPQRPARDKPRLTNDGFELIAGNMAYVVFPDYRRIQQELTEELKPHWDSGLIWASAHVYKYSQYADAYYQFNVKKFSEKEIRHATFQYMKSNCGVDIIEILKKQADESVTKD